MLNSLGYKGFNIEVLLEQHKYLKYKYYFKSNNHYYKLLAALESLSKQVIN